jgi:hypothetical protein
VHRRGGKCCVMSLLVLQRDFYELNNTPVFVVWILQIYVIEETLRRM